MFGLPVLIFFYNYGAGGGLKRESPGPLHIASRLHLNQREFNCCECFDLEFVFVLFQAIHLTSTATRCMTSMVLFTEISLV